MRETSKDRLAGYRVVLALAEANPLAVDEERLAREAGTLFLAASRAQGSGERQLEIAWNDLSRLLFCRLGLRFTQSMDEIQMCFACHASTLRPVEGAGQLMRYLQEEKIETAVLSNTSFSSCVLEALLIETIPECRPKFVMTSSEHLFLKPSPLLFEAMLAKTGHPREAVWFCGNNFKRDAMGAVQAGITSILLDEAGRHPKGPDYTKVGSLVEIVDLLEQSKRDR